MWMQGIDLQRFVVATTGKPAVFSMAQEVYDLVLPVILFPQELGTLRLEVRAWGGSNGVKGLD